MTTLIPVGRDPVDPVELQALRERRTLVFDEQRRRPRYFDGRFLAARDLTREQTYFLSRQATLGQVLGSGVVSGLRVTPGAEAGAVRIAPGHGLTPAGELVAIDPVGAGLEVRLADVTESEGLNAAFGLRRLPRPPARARTGLYVLGLRPVEFTANPIAAYPTSVDGPRSVQDGEIVEATAVTLVPYREEGTGEVEMRRARVARDLFVAGSTRGIPAEVLPLALLALERGIVQWIDPFLVRRELGSQHGDLAGLGLSPRALREAYLVQYEFHLQDVLAERKARGLSETFAATEHFLALPPAGRLPKGAVDAATFTQTFFPPEVDVELAMVPEDEVPALFRDSLLLPPLDLTVGPEGFASTPVLALVPVGRDQLRQLSGTLDRLTRGTRATLPMRIARQSPIALLQGIKLARLDIPALPAAGDPIDEAWRQALAGAASLWFVRRRNLSQRLERRAVNLAVKPEAVLPPGPAGLGEGVSQLSEILAPLALQESFRKVLAKGANDEVRLAIVRLLLTLGAVRLLLAGALQELDKRDALDAGAVKEVAQRFSQPGLTTAIDEIARLQPKFFEVTRGRQKTLSPVGKALVAGNFTPEMAALAAKLNTREKVAAVTQEITQLVGNREGVEVKTELQALIERKLKEPA